MCSRWIVGEACHQDPVSKGRQASPVRLVPMTLPKPKSYPGLTCVPTCMPTQPPAETLTSWLASLPFPPTGSSREEVPGQLSWRQRVSVWLQGMCLRANIWGLMIIIRNIFLKRKQTCWQNGDTKPTGFCHKNTVGKKNLECFEQGGGNLLI